MSHYLPILPFLRIDRDDRKSPAIDAGLFVFKIYWLIGWTAKIRAQISNLEMDLMRQFFAMTFGGLTPSYYARQLFFGALFAAFFIYMKSRSPSGIDFANTSLAVVSTLLYPYARFVYESVVGFIMGGNVFFVNALLMLATKIITMFVCWFLAIFIAPLGLLYLYWYHSRQPSN
ncbi:MULTISPECIES: hypothetical protein [Pseudomonas]|jgi:hypothetical protein|uniref:hypothetical protein n=1 Tax=Pseudomonas TaxID=286 RepID=UPI003075C225